jgi:hypothetical protein
MAKVSPQAPSKAEAPPWATQSPGFLASQPPMLDDAPKPVEDPAEARKRKRNNETIQAHAERRMNWMRTMRWVWWRQAGLIAQFIVPHRWHFFIYANRTYRDGIVNQAIIDSSATDALQICASGLWSGITNPSKEWFKLEIALPWRKPNQQEKLWLKDTTERIFAALAQTNFYSTAAQLFEDMSAFGTAPMIIYENDDTVFTFYLPCPGEYFLQVGSTYTVDVLYREYTNTVAQLVQEFGLAKLPTVIQREWKRGGASMDKEFVVCHAIEPNNELMHDKSGDTFWPAPKVMPYREIYWIRQAGTDGVISVTGDHEKPFVCGRWSKVSNDAYAPSCPGMTALGDTQQLQLETRRKAEFIEKGVRPPMGADVSLENKPLSITPGATTFMQTDGGTVKKYFPLYEPAAQWLAGITADIIQVIERIKRTFKNYVFNAITDMEGVQPRNELELTKRENERLQQLGPPINLIIEEFAGPTIRRCEGIMRRKGMLQPMPATLHGVPLKIKYTGILEIAQQQAQQVALENFLQKMGEASLAALEAKQPSPLRKVNLDKLADHYADLCGVPPDIMRTDEEVQQLDIAAHQAMQQANAPNTAMTAVQAASTLGNTPSGPGNLLHSMLNPGQAGAAAPAPANAGRAA